MLLLHNACLWQWDDFDDSQGPAASSPGGRLSKRSWCLVDTVRGVFEAVAFANEDNNEENDEANAANHKAAQAKATRTIDMQGGIVLPGLIDAHIHVGYMGEAQEYLQLAGCRTLAELGAAVAAYGKAHPSKSWLVGVGWDQSVWGGEYPTRQDLDEAMGNNKRPVVLYRACWHIVVANTAALERGGISLTPTEEVRFWWREGRRETGEGVETITIVSSFSLKS